ncbi:hypothetical protein BDV95DRAFT_568697 [Massariosphaeria phaeospora]|uniref:Uncharacterized protein n=1 Tax=Massariosphaeria phaeospora TaxID=100035 RepID=A0A7C8IA22_9PLEO|nr:hypothetical protein BDV95DRAFT_568697 [Massariosphaeria phaeospora]
MTSLFPHAPYAEDQSRAHEILYLHVIRAAAMMGSGIAMLTAPVSLLVSRYRHNTPFDQPTFIPRLLIHAGRGIVIGSVLGGLMTWGRMRGKEEIEWQDRSWRILENKGEVNTDWWTIDGAAIGAVAGVFLARGGRLPMSVTRSAVGGAGIGMNAGVNYMFYSFNNGRKPA